MAGHQHKRFIPRQAIGGLLVSISAVLFLAVLFSNLPPDFWSAAGIMIWLGLAAIFAAALLQFMRSGGPSA